VQHIEVERFADEAVGATADAPLPEAVAAKGNR